MNKQILRHSVLLGTVVLLVIASTASVVQAASLCVHPKGRDGCFSSIQAAVDAANDGDQVIIRPGKYTEQVTIIDKDLTLIGREGAVVQAPPAMEQTLLDATGSGGRPIIGVVNAEITIRDLIIDGLNSAESNPFIEGIAFFNAGGVIRNNLVRNVGFGKPTLPVDPDTGAPLYQGDGIVVINPTATPRTIIIEENRIVNYNDIGIVVGSFADANNPTVANLTADVHDNIVIGLGMTDVIDQWGIVMFSENFEDSQFFIAGTIRNNRVRDMVSIDPYPFPAIGIEMNGLSNVVLTDNFVENVNIGIDALRAFNIRISENRIVGPDSEAAESDGLFLSGSDIQVIHNSFRQLDFGILLSIENESLGNAFNTVLDENRFENVPVDVLTEPGSSALAKAALGSLRLQRYHAVTQP